MSNMQMAPENKPAFPIFASRAEAEAYSDQVGDAYFEIGYWLEGQLNLCCMEMHEVYVNQSGPRRRMQTGIVRQHVCREDFRMVTLQGIIQTCQRYAAEETCHAYTVRDALAKLGCELKYRLLSFDLRHPDPQQTIPVLGLLCDWIESELHFLSHQSWHQCPDSFSPNETISHLSNIGMLEKQLAHLPARDRQRFHGLLDRGATQFGTSKAWSQVGKTMHDPKPRVWTNPKLDCLAIALWPLVQHYNWTYRDLLAVICRIFTPPLRYPLETERELATYCQNILGLRKSGVKGRSSPDGKPPGWEVAINFRLRNKKVS